MTFTNVANVARDISSALFNLDFHRQLAANGKMGENVIRVDDFYIVRKHYVAGTDDTFAVLA